MAVPKTKTNVGTYPIRIRLFTGIAHNMSDFVRCNKVSGVYWLKTSVAKIKIDVIVKPPDDILSLPKFEEYSNGASSISIHPKIEEHSFKWQEKVFSAWEIHYLSNQHNCNSDNEIKYHEMIKNNEIVPSKIFTYIHEDDHRSLPVDTRKKKENSFDLIMEYLSLNETVGSIGRAFGAKTDSMHHLLKSRDSLHEEEKWTAMHVMYDHSEHNKDSLPLKHESTLLSVYHNTTHNYVILCPDVNELESNPYIIDGYNFKYALSVDLGGEDGSDDLKTLLTNLHSKWQTKHGHLVNFVSPAAAKIQYHISIELMSAEQFHMDNLYIDYTIKLPESVHSEDAVHGRSHTSQSTAGEDFETCHFGHHIELCLEADAQSDLPPVNLYLEVISVDFRKRHRTEGYTYHRLPLDPGCGSQELSCLRPEERRGQERRFYVGGCHLIEDLDVLSRAGQQNANFTYTETGKIHIRYSIIRQRGSVTPAAGSSTCDPGSGSSVLQGAEAALKKYKRARARLAAATKDINIGSGDG